MQASRDTINLIANVIRKNGSIDLPAHGSSMFPLIREGEICRFIRCDSSLLKKGDIALFRTWSGQLVAHRFHRYRLVRQRQCLVFKGDTNLGTDEPIAQEQLIGKLVRIQKANSIIRDTDCINKIWSKLMVTFPFLSLFLKIVLIQKK